MKTRRGGSQLYNAWNFTKRLFRRSPKKKSVETSERTRSSTKAGETSRSSTKSVENRLSVSKINELINFLDTTIKEAFDQEFKTYKCDTVLPQIKQTFNMLFDKADLQIFNMGTHRGGKRLSRCSRLRPRNWFRTDKCCELKHVLRNRDMKMDVDDKTEEQCDQLLRMDTLFKNNSEEDKRKPDSFDHMPIRIQSEKKWCTQVKKKIKEIVQSIYFKTKIAKYMEQTITKHVNPDFKHQLTFIEEIKKDMLRLIDDVFAAAIA